MNENNTHPLTESRAAELWDKHRGRMFLWHNFTDRIKSDYLAVLRAAYDAGSAEWKANAEAAAERAERAEEKLAGSVHVDEDERPWEPLGQNDPLHAGDEVWREWRGVSTRGIVDVQRFDSQVYTAERGHLGHQGIGTWYVRRAVKELPTEDGAVIVPAEGHEYIATNEGMAHALVHLGGKWYGGASRIDPEQITPGTWRSA